MKSSNINKLCCPACRKRYSLRVVNSSNDRIETALLTCSRCCITIPVLRGFPIFDQQFLAEDPNLDDLTAKLFGPPEEYLEFLDRKHEKPVYDLYAAFQPFNESTQSIFPLLPLLKEVVKPGDLILDLWCRTGWTGEFLSAIFPEQQVISVWESSSGLLVSGLVLENAAKTSILFFIPQIRHSLLRMKPLELFMVWTRCIDIIMFL
jgi:uncharacterized protein YbaR (Trm112 family)